MNRFFILVIFSVFSIVLLTRFSSAKNHSHSIKSFTGGNGCDSLVKIPVEFDPQKNGKFIPVFNDSLPVEYSLDIFDVYGNKIFSSIRATQRWNGRMNNKGAPVGDASYMWTLNFRMNNDKNPHSCKGFVNCTNMANALPVQAMDTLDCDTIVYVPNAFSPNGDGANDEFLPRFGCPPSEYELWIFDRWGNMIFDTKKANEGWSGLMKNGSVAEMRVYVWKIKCSYFPGDRIHQYVGHVTMIQ